MGVHIYDDDEYYIDTSLYSDDWKWFKWNAFYDDEKYS